MISYHQAAGSESRTHLAFIELEGIDVTLEIGVAPHEKERKQRLIIDVIVGIADKMTRIADSEAGLTDGFDYGQVRTCVMEAAESKVYLLETLANRVADGVLLLPGALTCSVKVTKTRCWADVEGTSVRVDRVN